MLYVLAHLDLMSETAAGSIHPCNTVFACKALKLRKQAQCPTQLDFHWRPFCIANVHDGVTVGKRRSIRSVYRRFEIVFCFIECPDDITSHLI